MNYLKLYIQTTLLLETLDEIEENGGFKQRVKHLKQEIENFDKSIFEHTDELDKVVEISEKVNEILKEYEKE
jgi:CRISPR/Cas system CSM-associated protein Csm5 (group 7 of RAMP superfamily)